MFGDPPELESAQSARVWVPWYFTRGAAAVITIPLFLLFAYAAVVSAVAAVTQFIALARATHAVWGWLGLVVVLLGAWIPLIIPPSLYYSVLKNIPGLWIRRDASNAMKGGVSIALIIVFPLIAYLISHAITLGIGWVADRDPCASARAGVTGSIVPTACR